MSSGHDPAGDSILVRIQFGQLAAAYQRARAAVLVAGVAAAGRSRRKECVWLRVSVCGVASACSVGSVATVRCRALTRAVLNVASRRRDDDRLIWWILRFGARVRIVHDGYVFRCDGTALAVVEAMLRGSVRVFLHTLGA